MEQEVLLLVGTSFSYDMNFIYTAGHSKCYSQVKTF